MAKKTNAPTEPKQLNTNTPTPVRWFKNLFDIVAAVVILAAAVIGAAEQIKHGNATIRVGAACVVIGLLGARLLERLFDRRYNQ